MLGELEEIYGDMKQLGRLLPDSDNQYDVADDHRGERRTVERDESDAKLLRQTWCAKKQ